MTVSHCNNSQFDVCLGAKSEVLGRLSIVGLGATSECGDKNTRLSATCFGEQAHDAKFLARNHVGGR